MANKPPLQKKFPLHWAVYVDDVDQLLKELEDLTDTELIDLVDCRGRTPLMLAVTLGHKQCANELLKAGADADVHNKHMWSVSHEAVALGDFDLITEVIKYRDFQRSRKATEHMRKHLMALKDTPDFYCEMSWEFSSWIPFVSRMCPSDTYKIYKQGSSVRIDTTLVGFEATNWKRGNQSYIFQFSEYNQAQFILLDHDARTASIQTLVEDEELEEFAPTPASVDMRLHSPVSTTYIDVDRIAFERSKGGGLLSWINSSEKWEIIDGYDCKVFDASNVNLVTKTRTEHLSEADKAELKEDELSGTLNKVLKLVRTEQTDENKRANAQDSGLTANEYLDHTFPLACDIGKKKEVIRRSNNFKATLYLAEQYPLDLQDQVIRIVDLMSASNAHFARLNNFIRMQLPAGFPVKIEIPLFHVVSAKITFGNINEPGPYVTPLETGTGFTVSTVAISEEIFEIPATYRSMDTNESINWPEDDGMFNESALYHPSAQRQEDMLLQLAIQQSLGVDMPPMNDYGVAANSLPGYRESEEVELARAIHESQMSSPGPLREDSLIVLEEAEDEISKAIRLSKEEADREQAEMREMEAQLQQVLEWSKIEK